MPTVTLRKRHPSGRMISPMQPSWATWSGPPLPQHRLHPLNPQGHPGAERIRDGTELLSLPGLWKSTTVPWTSSPAWPSPLFPEESFLRVPLMKVHTKRTVGRLGMPELEQSPRRASTGPRPQQKPKQALPMPWKHSPGACREDETGRPTGTQGTLFYLSNQGLQTNDAALSKASSSGTTSLPPPPMPATQL